MKRHITECHMSVSATQKERAVTGGWHGATAHGWLGEDLSTKASRGGSEGRTAWPSAGRVLWAEGAARAQQVHVPGEGRGC